MVGVKVGVNVGITVEVGIIVGIGVKVGTLVGVIVGIVVGTGVISLVEAETNCLSVSAFLVGVRLLVLVGVLVGPFNGSFETETEKSLVMVVIVVGVGAEVGVTLEIEDLVLLLFKEIETKIIKRILKTAKPIRSKRSVFFKKLIIGFIRRNNLKQFNCIVFRVLLK
jgi:hypothetical protein